jgi:hypothetical protein
MSIVRQRAHVVFDLRIRRRELGYGIAEPHASVRPVRVDPRLACHRCVADSGADAVGLDWTENLGKARALVGNKVALQGNLDPNVLFAKPEQIRTEVERALKAFGKPGPGSGHVFNLGHGISQFTPPEAVTAMVSAVHDISRQMRA